MITIFYSKSETDKNKHKQICSAILLREQDDSMCKLKQEDLMLLNWVAVEIKSFVQQLQKLVR